MLEAPPCSVRRKQHAFGCVSGVWNSSKNASSGRMGLPYSSTCRDPHSVKQPSRCAVTNAREFSRFPQQAGISPPFCTSGLLNPQDVSHDHLLGKCQQAKKLNSSSKPWSKPSRSAHSNKVGQQLTEWPSESSAVCNERNFCGGGWGWGRSCIVQALWGCE